MKRIQERTYFAMAFSLLLLSSYAFSFEQPLRLANSFGKSMVFQRDMPVPVWGWASPETAITVEFKEQRKTVQADADGCWRVILDPMPADAKPDALKVSCLNTTISADDILIGDVWLCAGPGVTRNMGALQNAKSELAKARFPQVRILRPDTYSSIVPIADIPPPAKWTVVDPQGIEKYAVTWYVGRELHLATGVPIGVVLANMNSEHPQEWFAWRKDPADRAQAEALKLLSEQLPHDIARAEKWLFNMKNRQADAPIDLLLFPTYIPYAFYNRHPVYEGPFPISYRRSSIYNALIGPLAPMSFRGVIFNCEFESKHAATAPDAIKELIETWRFAWRRPNCPFVIAQPLGKKDKSKGSESIATAAERAATLKNVAVMQAPESFSDQKSESYWNSVARVALQIPKDEIVSPLKTSEWNPPTLLPNAPLPARQPLEAAHLFSDNMVLQCDQLLKVWGWSEPGESVSVSLAGQLKESVADASGRWQVILDSLKPGDSALTMTIKNQTDTLTFSNVLVGEVWINSGQSNSGYVLSATLGFAEEQPAANYPTIRYFANARAANVLPQRINTGKWIPVNPDSAGHFSGMGYYFARALHRKKNVSVGIIEANHGGSSILSWISDAAFLSSPRFASIAADRAAVREEMIANLPLVEESVRQWVTYARKNAALERPVMAFPVDASPIRPFYGSFLQNPMNRRGSMFYNAMIHSMIGYGIKGVIWNQGEADTGNERTILYDDLMAAMITDWRKCWGYEFPFFYVQMPARKSEAGLCGMWEAQTRALAKLPSSGMIVCNDISEPGTIYEVHPRDKKNVGERLARLALVRTYGVKGMVDSSPMMESVTGDGNRIIVTFSAVGDGLKTRDEKPSDSWEIAGDDGKFVAANAEVSGAKVIVTANGVNQPVAVRLGWKSDSNCNLVNSEGLPAMPFTCRSRND